MPSTIRPPVEPVEDQDQLKDDAIIGKAALWSGAAIILLAAVVFGAVWYATRPKPGPPVAVVHPTQPARPQARAAEPPEVAFADIAKPSGVTFIPTNGATGEKLLPETMVGGVAFLDYDSDGDQDLLFTNARTWDAAPGAPGPSPVLYQNDGQGRFTDVTAAVGLDRVSVYGMGVAVADYDADADTDIYLTALGRNVLLRNDAGRFTDVTQQAGVAGSSGAWSTSAGFADLDGDGDLDLFVCNYVKWSRDIDFEVDYQLTGIGRAYGPPTNYEGQHCVLYQNNADGSFTDVSQAGGVQVANEATGVPVSKALGLRFVDIDADSRLDIVVSNDTTRNFVFKNLGGMRFDEVGQPSSIAYSGMGAATGAMGIDSARIRDDSCRAIAIGNFANEKTSLYTAAGSPDPWLYLDAADIEGVGASTRKSLTFGLFFFDYDLDGRPDLFHANGHVEDQINTVQSSQRFAQPPQLFWNAGDPAGATFVEVAPSSGGALHTPIVGRGAAYADIDGDGDLDIAIAQVNGVPLLLRNDQDLGNHFVRLKLIGRGPNTDAIGAVVRAIVDGHPVSAEVMPTRSYLSQVELPVTIGMGKSTSLESLKITWPGGVVQDIDPASVRIDALNTITQRPAQS